MKAVSLFSGGFDSPVSTYLMLKRNVDVTALFFDIAPFSSIPTKDIVIKGMRNLERHGLKQGYMMRHGENLKEIMEKCPRKFTCVFCKRMMLRVAEAFARKRNAKAIITGEVLGSKASQTGENMKVISSAIKMPVLKPVLCFNKEEIMKIAREIGTYESSSVSSACTAVPRKPSTRAKLGRIEEWEKALDIKGMVKRTLKSAERVV